MWKRRSAAAESQRQTETPPGETEREAPATFRSATAPDGQDGLGGHEARPVPPSPAPTYGHDRVSSRTVRGRVLRADAAGASAGEQTLPAVTTVTAHRRDGTVTGSTVSEDGAYVLDGLPAEPLTLVAVEHPAVHEDVVVRAGDQRHDISLPAFPRKDLR
ncbi:hypothetical protein GCM10009676_46460 [Prauserella halophila]|uniref:Carboxypeptidase regulatory-like domain-containing protein n=1 Tax=Prauserella halophila TaxID=185641 RepID=A0ABP4HCT5_9PSEU